MMNRLSIHFAIAAAALTAVATSASAQTLKAEIPFSFRAGKILMQPGSYDVQRRQSAGNVDFLIRNNDTKEAVFVLPNVNGSVPKAWAADGQARLSFACADGRCALQKIWSGEGTTYSLPVPKKALDGMSQSAEIVMTKANAN